jgi:phage FluMu protein Com
VMATAAASEYRCPKCGRLLFIGHFVGWIEVKCQKCVRVRRFDS